MRILPDSIDFDGDVDAHVEVFNQAIDQCFELYRTSAQQWNASVGALPIQAAETVELMDDLARGLLIKIFLAVVQAGQHFGPAERQLAQALAHKLWGRSFSADEIGRVLLDLIPLADKFNWYHLVRPFDDVPVLRDRVDEVETTVMRFGNLVAKADGTINADEAARLKGLLIDVSRHLRPVPLESGAVPHPSAATSGQQIRRALDTVAAGEPAARPSAAQAAQMAKPTDEERLQTALASLDELIGLGAIKTEVRELTRFLRVQQQREQAGLPRTQVSLHTVFAGNPGTGKTSVARVLGEVFGALGIVRQGHLVEADRSTLVAGYMGQTAERTNKVVDQALDGVLFIDEAYSLISDRGDDPFGQEAVQILLKRMEDNRGRLIVVLAGYSDEMQRLLDSNPGLASRFQRTFDFPNFTVVELCRIFQSLCEKNHYLLPAATRARLLLGFAHLLAQSDPHFGNGRVVRNVFERAIRRLANRIADIAPLTRELLTRLEPQDVLLDDVPESAIGADATRELVVNIVCPGCQNASRLPAGYLGRRAQCNKCQVQFTADWGEPAGPSDA